MWITIITILALMMLIIGITSVLLVVKLIVKRKNNLSNATIEELTNAVEEFEN